MNKNLISKMSDLKFSKTIEQVISESDEFNILSFRVIPEVLNTIFISINSALSPIIRFTRLAEGVDDDDQKCIYQYIMLEKVIIYSVLWNDMDTTHCRFAFKGNKKEVNKYRKKISDIINDPISGYENDDQIRTAEKMLKHVNDFYSKEKTGELISLWDVYEDYGNPANKTPREVLNYSLMRAWVEEFIVHEKMEIEEVIQYHGRDIHVNFILAIRYIGYLDYKNYHNTEIWRGVMGADIIEPIIQNYVNGISESDLEEYDIPF